MSYCGKGINKNSTWHIISFLIWNHTYEMFSYKNMCFEMCWCAFLACIAQHCFLLNVVRLCFAILHLGKTSQTNISFLWHSVNTPKCMWIRIMQVAIFFLMQCSCKHLYVWREILCTDITSSWQLSVTTSMTLFCWMIQVSAWDCACISRPLF